MLSAILSIRQPTRKETPWQNLITSSRKVRKNWPRKKKKEEKRQRKLENKAVETDETEKDPFNGGPVSIGIDQHQLPELYNGNN
jgi:chromatin remodeling complex protein RSC6